MLAHIAYRNTLKNWRHSISALLSLSASFVSLVMFDGYMNDIENVFYDSYRYHQMLGDVLIENPQINSEKGVTDPWNFWLDSNQQSEIELFLSKEKDKIFATTRSLNIQGMVSSGKRSYIFVGRGYDVNSGAKMRREAWDWDTPLGMPLNESQEPMAAAVGFGMAKKMGCIIPDQFPFLVSSGNYPHEVRPFDCKSKELQLSTTTPEGQLNAIDLNLVGIIDGGYKDLDDRVLHTSLEAAQMLMNTDKVSYYSVQLNDPKEISNFIAAFEKTVRAKFPNVSMVTWQAHPVGESYVKTMEFLSIFRNFIIIVILVVSTLSVVNTLVKIVKERTKEIGTLRSIGFKKIEIIKLFIYESIFLAFLGSIIGSIFSMVFSFVINSIGITYKAGMLSNPISFKIIIVPQSYLSAWILLVVVSLLASYISTATILKGKVVENLNHI